MSWGMGVGADVAIICLAVLPGGFLSGGRLCNVPTKRCFNEEEGQVN